LYGIGIEYGERGILIYMDAVSAYPEQICQESQTESIALPRKASQLGRRLIGKWRRNANYGKQ
jgi:hypothetical protein